MIDWSQYHRRTNIEGFDYFYLELGTPGKHKLFLLHGFPFDHRMWCPLLEYALNTKEFSQFHIIVPDLAGMGQTINSYLDSAGEDISSARVTSMDMLARHIFTLSQKTAGGDFGVCGLSMGGYVALQLAAHYSSRINLLVLADTNAHGDTASGAAKRLALADKINQTGDISFLADSMLPNLFSPQTLRQFEESKGNGVPEPESVSLYRKMVCENQPRGVASAARGMAVRESYSGEYLPALSDTTLFKYPHLCITGEHDILSPPDQMHQLSQRYPSSQFISIAGAGHLSPMENPVDFWKPFQELIRSRTDT